MYASKTTSVRYEGDRSGELVHVDGKKIGHIPDGGGWRAHGRREQVRGRGIGYDYVHSMVDDHSRLAYSEVLPDEEGTTCADFLIRAAAYFAGHSITRIERVMTDNAFAYRHSLAFRQAVAAIGARQRVIRPHCPLQNGPGALTADTSGARTPVVPQDRGGSCPAVRCAGPRTDWGSSTSPSPGSPKHCRCREHRQRRRPGREPAVLIDDAGRFDSVAVIGVDEHVWRHTRRGDKYVTVLIDLTPIRDKTGPSRLLHMVPGRSKQASKVWLAQRPKGLAQGG